MSAVLMQMHEQLQGLDQKVDDIQLGIDDLLDQLGQGETQAQARAEQAQGEREAMMRELDQIKSLVKVKSKGSLSDSFSIHSAHEMQLIKKLLTRFRSLPEDQKARCA